MAESRSTRRAAPADSQDTADPGNKKTRSPVCLKIILLQRGEFFYTLLPRHRAARSEGEWKPMESMSKKF